MSRATRIRNAPGTVPGLPATIRVAIYCRQSVEDTTSTFNSLEAQRAAVEAYVASQSGEGWAALPQRYDDGGYSGANIERPAFKRLLKDIEAGRIDVVGVYRIDRLSRSQADFVRVMEAFRQHAVTFCSVTEHFNTTTPSGRAMLSFLATFAQLERETISERTRDKMRAARQRGMWTGGRPVVGYDLIDKKLVVNPNEADQVRTIFNLYLQQGSLMATVEEVNRRGWHTKSWKTKEGRAIHGSSYDKTTLRALLRSPLYVGRMPLGDESFPGSHDPIVNEDLWTAVQVQLTKHGRRGGSDAKNKYGLLLKGLLVCGACGSSMTGHHTQRGARRWMFYVCSKVHKKGAKACPGSRVSVGEIEPFVVEKIREIGRDPALVRAAIVAAKAERDARGPELEAEMRRLEADRRQRVSERNNLLTAISGGGSGTAILVERLGEIDGLSGVIEDRLAEITRDLVATTARAINEDDLRSALENFDPVWDELFPRERARILALLVERVVYTRTTGEVSITFRPRGVASLGRSRASA